MHNFFSFSRAICRIFLRLSFLCPPPPLNFLLTPPITNIWFSYFFYPLCDLFLNICLLRSHQASKSRYSSSPLSLLQKLVFSPYLKHGSRLPWVTLYSLTILAFTFLQIIKLVRVLVSLSPFFRLSTTSCSSLFLRLNIPPHHFNLLVLLH